MRDLLHDRLRHVLPGITLGAATTLIGYVTLMLAPFPGLHQLAVFSAVGLLGSFITIVLWLPFLDSPEPLARGARILAMANLLWVFWEDARYRRWRWSAIALIGIMTIVGATRLRIDDDIRHQQALAGNLRDQESADSPSDGNLWRNGISAGARGGSRTARCRPRRLWSARLTFARQDGAIRGFQSLAQFVPSVARQRDNRALVNDKLMRPYLASYYQRLGITGRRASWRRQQGIPDPRCNQ